MSEAEPRVHLPARAGRGEVVPVRALIAHAMETGLRSDSAGRIIPRRIVKRFVCLFEETEVFSADFHESVAANPYLEFELVARASGRLTFRWYEDGGAVFSTGRDLLVD